MKAILGRKLGMTRIFTVAGTVVPVTLIEAKPNIVSKVNSKAKENVDSIQIAIPQEIKINKPQAGHLKKVNIKSRILREFGITAKNLGDQVDLSQFTVGEKVAVSATSKGRGFAGTVKRHHFHTGPKTHGSNNYRQPGSIGAQQPQRVVKGRRMAGHLGFDQVTTKNLEIIQIDLEHSIIFLRGAVPGPTKAIVSIWSENE